MKYMGSKRAMLDNGLGEVLAAEGREAARFVDLFCGSGAVSWFVAARLEIPVFALDLQSFATALAGAVVERTAFIPTADFEDRWLAPAERRREASSVWARTVALEASGASTTAKRERSRRLCAEGGTGRYDLVWSRYGGHYFSPRQALTLDAMVETLPGGEMRATCLAATIMAASRCAAAPGHTAQPFRATGAGGEYLRRAWSRDPLVHARKAAGDMGATRALRKGSTEVGDANAVANTLAEDDLVFVDPPYSAVQYSRFYHVLETIARQESGPVEGKGRYPPYEERPQSRYSLRTASRAAMAELLERLAARGCTVVLTFPRDEAGNRLSGVAIERLARRSFRVQRHAVSTRFSTLGGNGTNRDARKDARELILVLRPK